MLWNFFNHQCHYLAFLIDQKWYGRSKAVAIMIHVFYVECHKISLPKLKSVKVDNMKITYLSEVHV